MKLAPLLADTFSVYAYDRRGRGDSGSRLPYAVEREVDDLAALVEHAGGRASLFGSSSGATLALETARRGLPIERLALYEAPMIVDDSSPPVGGDYLSRIQALVDAGRAGDVIKVFLREGIRVPAPFVFLMPLLPAWSRLKAVADPLAYDTLIVEEYLHGKPLSADRWHSLAVPTLVERGRQESTLDAERDASTRRRAPQCRAPHARRPDSHGQAHSARARACRLPRHIQEAQRIRAQQRRRLRGDEINAERREQR